jgi:hypothetical protein
MNNLYPHFLIVGAPKCGTTALHSYLSQHPEINMSPKEIHYFGKDLNYKFSRPSLEKYQSYFKKTGINGDGSVWYFYSDSIYKELKDLGISPKIIVLLRNPVEVIYSLHSQNIMDANENISDFETALSLEKSRKTGNNLPPNVDPPRTVYYKNTADFYPRMQLLQENIHSENIFVGLQEDLKMDTKKFLEKIESFLGLSHFENFQIEPVNENHIVKNKVFHQHIKKPSSFEKSLIRTLIPFKGIRSWLIHKVYNSNIIKTKRADLSEKTKADLKSYFHSNTKKLNEIISPDISHWLK